MCFKSCFIPDFAGGGTLQDNTHHTRSLKVQSESLQTSSIPWPFQNICSPAVLLVALLSSVSLLASQLPDATSWRPAMFCLVCSLVPRSALIMVCQRSSLARLNRSRNSIGAEGAGIMREAGVGTEGMLRRFSAVRSALLIWIFVLTTTESAASL